MAKAKEAGPTGPREIETMKRLAQTSAGWLLGLSGRSLRDHGDIPRNPNGTYDAKRLLDWAKGRIPSPDMSDEQEEALLVACEHFEREAVGLAVGPVAELLTDLQDSYGDAGLAEFARLLLAHCREEIERNPDGCREPTAAELQQRARQLAADERRRAAYAGLRLAVVCEGCGRLRRGRRWVKGVEPPPNFEIQRGVCPTCERR